MNARRVRFQDMVHGPCTAVSGVLLFGVSLRYYKRGEHYISLTSEAVFREIWLREVDMHLGGVKYLFYWGNTLFDHFLAFRPIYTHG